MFYLSSKRIVITVSILIALAFGSFMSCNQLEPEPDTVEGKSRKKKRLQTELEVVSRALTGLRNELAAAKSELTAARAEMESKKLEQGGRPEYERQKELVKQSVVINKAVEAVLEIEDNIISEKQKITDLEKDIAAMQQQTPESLTSHGK